jgi:hypothetical protein
MQRLVVDADLSADELRRLLTLFVPRPVVVWLEVADEIRYGRIKSRYTREALAAIDVTSSETLNVCRDIIGSFHARMITLANDATPDVAPATLRGDLPLFWRR